MVTPSRAIPIVLLVGAAAAALVLHGCDTPTETPPEPPPEGQTTYSDTFPQLSAVETAAALSDSSRVMTGVWSLLKNLRIGVYTIDGTRVMAGAEQDDNDFWIYRHQLPQLAALALEGPGDRTYFDYYAWLQGMGYQGMDASALFDHYAAAYGPPNDTTFLVQVLRELGADFENGGMWLPASPLVQALLFLDTFVDPAGTPPADSSFAGFAMAGGGTGPAASAGPVSDLCGAYQALNDNPLWGLAKTGWDVANDVKNMFTAVDVWNAFMIDLGVETTLSPEAVDLTAGAATQTQRFTAEARYVFDLPEEVVKCGPLAGFSFPPAGPIPNMRVDWDLTAGLTPDHAVMRGPDGNWAITFTDGGGSTWTDLEVRPQRAGLPIREETGNAVLTAHFNTQQALGNYFGISPMLFTMLVSPEKEAGVDLSWQEVAYLTVLADSGAWAANTAVSITDQATEADTVQLVGEPLWEPVSCGRPQSDSGGIHFSGVNFLSETATGGSRARAALAITADETSATFDQDLEAVADPPAATGGTRTISSLATARATNTTAGEYFVHVHNTSGELVTLNIEAEQAGSGNWACGGALEVQVLYRNCSTSNPVEISLPAACGDLQTASESYTVMGEEYWVRVRPGLYTEARGSYDPTTSTGVGRSAFSGGSIRLWLEQASGGQ